MANFPIENRVKLTYNAGEVIIMAEFCVECLNKINGETRPKTSYILSFHYELCEECGEWKRVVVGECPGYRLLLCLRHCIKKRRA